MHSRSVGGTVLRNFSIMAAALLACTVPTAVSAQVINTDTTGAPLYFGGFPSIAVPFYVTTSGDYTLTQSADFDVFFMLFTDFVDPTNMNFNRIGVADAGDIGVPETIVIPLEVNQQYIALLGGFLDIDFGETTLTITGNEPVTLGMLSSAVPEPATWGLMIGGFALAGAAMRRRATKVSFA